MYVQHPDVHSARANRDYVLKQMSEALQTIYGAAQAIGKSEPSPLEAPGALSGALDNFDVSKINRDNFLRLWVVSKGPGLMFKWILKNKELQLEVSQALTHTV